MYNENIFMAYLIFGSIWIISSAGIALLITWFILRSHNNIGDSTCGINEYSKGIRYRYMADDVHVFEKKTLFADYGENPYAERKHRVPDILKKRGDNDG